MENLLGLTSNFEGADQYRYQLWRFLSDLIVKRKHYLGEKRHPFYRIIRLFLGQKFLENLSFEDIF
jgi:hypothetical protein